MNFMSKVWEELIKIQSYFDSALSQYGTEVSEPGMDRFNKPGWINKVWTSNAFRRAHLDVVDARETKGLWMMHCCIFPHLHNPAPIFGFDVVAGKNKITGCFFDYSPAGDPNHKLINWFENDVKDLKWKKTRTLPDWAERIFSKNMIAASNVQLDEEIVQIYDMATRGIEHYLASVWETNNTTTNTTDNQNFYTDNQRLNPHTPKVMVSLGLSEDDVNVFIKDCLFPKIN